MAGIAALVAGVIASQGLLSGMIYQYPPYVTGMARKTFGKHPNMLPPVDYLVQARYKGVMASGDYTKLAAEMGFESNLSAQIYDSSKRLLDGDAYIRLWRRGEIEELECDAQLSQLQFTTDDIARFKKSSEFFPGPNDLIRFAVREVYTPDIRTAFGMDEDRPEQFLTEAAKVGVPDDQAKNYWASHWELPSVAQVFEMFQRDVVDEDTMLRGLRALDIMPFWREKLKEINYRVLTRVDVRRMHKMGVLTDEETYDAYRHQGYSPNDAEKMLDFTLAYNADTDAGLSRSAVTRAYMLDLISKEELSGHFDTMGYSPEVKEFWLSMAEYEKVIEFAESEKAELFEQYRVGSITMDDVRRELGYRGLPASYTESAISKEQTQPSKKIKMPTKADLTDWYELGIIPEEVYFSRMTDIGYRRADVQLYMSEMEIEERIKPRRYLPIKTYQGWLVKGILSEDEFVAVATSMDYSEEDIANLILEVLEK